MSYTQQEEYWNDDHEHQYDNSQEILDEPTFNRSIDEPNMEQNTFSNSSSTEEMEMNDCQSESDDEDFEDVLDYMDARVQKNYESIIEKYSTRPTSVCMVNLLMLGVGILVTALYTKECYPAF